MGKLIKLPPRRKSAVVQILEELIDLAHKTDVQGIEFIVEFAGGATRVGAAGRYLTDLPAGVRAAQALERRLRWESSMRDTA
jgi:hypothetical protein